MANCSAKRIRSIVWFRNFPKAQENAHHLLHLLLVCMAVARDCKFDLHRRVFIKRHAGLLCGKHRYSAPSPHGKRCRRVAIKEKLFKNNVLRLINANKLPHAEIKLFQPFRKRFTSLCFNYAIVHRANFPAFSINDAIAQNRISRVDAEYDHNRCPSVSSLIDFRPTYLFVSARNPSGIAAARITSIILPWLGQLGKRKDISLLRR